MKSSYSIRRATGTAIGLVVLLLAAVPAVAQPTVDGLFYGGGDDALYQLWDTSYYGSDLYVYYHAPTTTLYVALVVDRAVNDNVFGASHAGFSGNYMASANWGAGGGQQRSAAALVNSEFAAFDFACAEGSPRQWAWQQGYSCLQSGTWVSNQSCGTSAVLTNGYPPTLQSASSFAWNMNTYNAAAIKPWNRDVFGTSSSQWKSPYSASNPNTSPPNNPNTVVGLEGYPAATNSGDLSQGPPITFNSTYQYEWPMVFEWSLNVGGNGTTTGAGCANNALFLLTGASHHSPMKSGVEGDFDTECGEENDCFPPGGGDNPLSDYGDLPSAYYTLTADGGPRHVILVSGPYLGSTVEVETDGVPTTDATGDGSEEDGVEAQVDENWTAGSTQSFEVEVANAPGGAVLGGWFDWNGDGDFSDTGEFFTWNVNQGTNNLSVTVGTGFDWQNDDLYSRFRVFSSGSAAPGGSLDQADSVGTATDGEVEDYVFEAGSLPVTLNAFHSEISGGALEVSWQTASETDNVGFEVWGLVRGEWQPISELVASRDMSSGLPQSYQVRLGLPEGLTALELVDYDTQGRQGRFGAFRLDVRRGEFQAQDEIDWRGPRAERGRRLAARGFTDTRIRHHGDGVRSVHASIHAGQDVRPDSGAARWKKLHRGAPVSGAADGADHVSVAVAASRGGKGGGNGSATVTLAAAPRTHVAVTEDGIQRVTYEALRDAGLDLSGVHRREVAVSFRGAPVARWISSAKLGPGSVIEFVGHAPEGDDALYLDANLYQVSVDAALATDAGTLGQGKAKDVSAAYVARTGSDEPLLYRAQSRTGDPWVERSILARGGRVTTAVLDLPVAGPVADGDSLLEIGLGSLTDLPDLEGPGGVLPEHNVEVWFRGADGAYGQVATSSVSGQSDWRIQAALPAGWLAAGLNQVELRFTTDYAFSLLVVDDYGVSYPAPYRGPGLDFAPDHDASGYAISGFAGPDVVAYAVDAGGALTRLAPRMVAAAGGTWSAELRQVDAERIWVTQAPHAPAVFTTEASPDLLAGPADLVILAGSGFVGTRALDDYVAQHADMNPVVVDVEDVYNAVGYGMALPSALTDYLAARDAVNPFSHVQLIGADCYDRLNHVSSCIGFVPLPTAMVGVSRFTPSQNRLVDLDGDGIGDKAVGQFSVRDEAELATVVAKADAWHDSGLAGGDAALLIAEEPDGLNDFAGQVGRLGSRLGWSGTQVLDLADHPQIQTARDAMAAALGSGRALTVFSGHSSPTVWSFRSLLTTGNAASVLTNDGRPTLMVPLACETTYDVSPSANVLGHQLLFAGESGAVAISGAVALSSLRENERMAEHVLAGLDSGRTLGEAVLDGRRALGAAYQELQDNWITQGDVALRMER